MKKPSPICALFMFLAAIPLHAGVILLSGDYQHTGDTSLSGDTFNRPVENGDAAPNTLSLDADAVGYDAFSFQVTTPGLYNLVITPVDFGFSSYLFLYETSFDPTAPLTNVLLGESNNDTTSSLSPTLLADTTYIAVVTGFSDFDEGAYSAEISEVSDVVPEPSTFMLISGIALLTVIATTLKKNSPLSQISKSGN